MKTKRRKFCDRFRKVLLSKLIAARSGSLRDLVSDPCSALQSGFNTPNPQSGFDPPEMNTPANMEIITNFVNNVSGKYYDANVELSTVTNMVTYASFGIGDVVDVAVIYRVVSLYDHLFCMCEIFDILGDDFPSSSIIIIDDDPKLNRKKCGEFEEILLERIGVNVTRYKDHFCGWTIPDVDYLIDHLIQKDYLAEKIKVEFLLATEDDKNGKN